MKKFSIEYARALTENPPKRKNAYTADEILDILEIDEKFAAEYDRILGQGKRDTKQMVSRSINSLAKHKAFGPMSKKVLQQNLTHFKFVKERFSGKRFERLEWSEEDCESLYVDDGSFGYDEDDRKKELVLCSGHEGEKRGFIIKRFPHWAELSDEASDVIASLIEEVLKEDYAKRTYFQGDDLSKLKYLKPILG